MILDLRNEIISLINNSLSDLSLAGEVPAIIVDVPAEKSHGEFSCNIALQLSRLLKKSPLDIAQTILNALNASLTNHPLAPKLKKIEIKKPGFINFYLSNEAFFDVLFEISRQNRRYGHSHFGQGRKTLVEFVSANPTGPLTVAHGRQAAVGDSLVNILNAAGFQALREYYINDEGNQINILGRSIKARAFECLGQAIDFPEDGYQGGYVKDMARGFINANEIMNVHDLNLHPDQAFREYGVEYLMDMIQKDLRDFGIVFDLWTSQAKVASDHEIIKVIEELRNKAFIYEQEGAWWFKSTAFGDDKDRVIKKSDGAYTYLMPDIVYHKNKFERGFDWLINFLGPDHHGYIPRIKAAVGALGRDPNDIHVEIIQLATIYRNGKPVSMSTRRGEFITLREVIDEVGKDAGRFFFLMRQTSAHLDFDLELAKKAAPENPVYYIQYAHARICSIIRKAADEHQLRPRYEHLRLLGQDEELELIRKLSHFTDVIITCAKQTDPFSMGRYLHELAATFHKFYDRHRVIDQEIPLSEERLALIDATRIVLANGLFLLGIAAPEKM
ncbi:MAG: arginine--tRNA ligase [Candidatus Omnitrophica bacterium]|nr:arginine--tRNA ligase [Candidatus Omnitrophota bacterium]